MNLLAHFRIRSFVHSSKAWFKQHVNDEFVKKANEQNYRSRAAFKLQQIQQKYHILGEKIIDLGSAPGSWSEFAIRYKKSKKITNNTHIVSVDILDMKHIEGVDFYKCDARDRNLHKMFKQKYGYFDSIISDMAPNFTGQSFETHEEILQLNKMCVKLALQLSHQNCNLVMKTTQGAHSKLFFEFLQILFESALRFKPKASRSQSKEFYFVCKKFRNLFHPQARAPQNKAQQHSNTITHENTPSNSQKIINFINKDFDSILLDNSSKKPNKKQLKKIIDNLVESEK